MIVIEWVVSRIMNVFVIVASNVSIVALNIGMRDEPRSIHFEMRGCDFTRENFSGSLYETGNFAKVPNGPAC